MEIILERPNVALMNIFYLKSLGSVQNNKRFKNILSVKYRKYIGYQSITYKNIAKSFLKAFKLYTSNTREIKAKNIA